MEHLSESKRHQLLSAERRRMVLDALATRDAPVELVDVARAVALRENDDGELDEETVDSAKISLHHVHLPKLASGGVIDYDAERNCVESSPNHHSV